MKRTRIMGLCLVAACAVFAVAATSAFALENLPHYGKCNKTAVGVGKYKNAGCTKLATTTESKKFEWESLEGKTVNFTSAKKKETGPAVLEAASGNEISCTIQGEKIGEYGPGDQVKNVIGEFKNCETSGFKCKSTGQNEGEIFTKKLKGEPGIIKKALKTEKKRRR